MWNDWVMGWKIKRNLYVCVVASVIMLTYRSDAVLFLHKPVALVRVVTLLLGMLGAAAVLALRELH